MGTVPASDVWTIAAKSAGESLCNFVKNQQATTTTSPAHQKIATIEDQLASTTMDATTKPSRLVAGVEVGVEAGVEVGVELGAEAGAGHRV
eukprot:11421-Heterococcus_DN1.PRE.1